MERGEFSHRDVESADETAEMLSAKRRCCFSIPYMRSSNRFPSASVRLNWWQRIRAKSDPNEASFWYRGMTALKKLREWSEIVAGPRWKTFIRRFNRCRTVGVSGGGGRRQGKFQYDPLSYALNFDEGPSQSGNPVEEDEYRFRIFSSRYASIPAPEKASMELGKDGPNLS